MFWVTWFHYFVAGFPCFLTGEWIVISSGPACCYPKSSRLWSYVARRPLNLNTIRPCWSHLTCVYTSVFCWYSLHFSCHRVSLCCSLDLTKFSSSQACNMSPWNQSHITWHCKSLPEFSNHPNPQKYLCVFWKNHIYVQHVTIEGLATAGGIQGTMADATVALSFTRLSLPSNG